MTYTSTRHARPFLSLPNVITVGRILLVPLAIWLIVSGKFLGAFIVFLLAGVSDAIDGFIAKRLGHSTELGAYLDPLADKLLLMSIYVSLGVLGHLPPWLVILVVSRDVLIIGAVLLSWLLGRPVEVRPLLVSKINTVAQIALAGIALAVLGFGWREGGDLIWWGSVAVAILTTASGAAYMRGWIRHMANGA